ncbi:hypothetical protein P692DRAFT_20742073, partial [Suillus brevipes Sb2]
LSLKEGQQLVGRVVQDRLGFKMPPGQVSQNTLHFLLAQPKDPACNDRDLFGNRTSIPCRFTAEKEFKDFIRAFTNMFTDVDSQIPSLPPKDVIHRIYRDVRPIINDKTPYKKGLSHFLRSGRKGVFVFYKLLSLFSLQPGDESVIAPGTWCPAKNEIATLRLVSLCTRSWLLKHSLPILPPPRPHPHGDRQSVFGHEDELKVAPKGHG